MNTRFQPPGLTGHILPRPRLLNTLRAHLDRTLILMTADAGYGKTTLLVQLILEAGLPCAWCRLEPADRDPAALLEHLLDTVRLHFPRVGRRLQASLQTGEVKREVAAAHLAHDFGRLSGLLIAIDDYHHVDGSQEVNALMDALLDRLPPSTHVLISTRTTPHLSLSRLRAQNALFEITTDDLRFTHHEIEALFAALGVPLDPQTLQALSDRTEGWVLALVLAYHSIRAKDTDAAKAFLRGLRGSVAHIYDYLSAEVFATQPPPIQAFLRATSILPRLQTDICNALLDVTTARETLRYLERNHLFTHCLDDERIRYRYHPLFQEFLQARLLADEGGPHAVDLHRKAARVLERHGLLEEAFDQFATAGEWSEAARLLEDLGGRLLDAGRLQMLTQFLDALPSAIAGTSGPLLFLRGRLLELQGRWTEARTRFEEAHALFARRGDASGLVHALNGLALTYVRQGQYGRTAELCQQALVIVAPEDRAARAETLRLLGGSYLETDDLDRGTQYMEEALEIFRALGQRRAEARVLHNIAYSVRFVRGDFLTALRMEEEAVRICEDVGDARTLIVCLIGLGHLRLVMGRHQEALQVLERLLRLCHEWQAEPARAYGLMLMADVYQELGERDRARTLYAEALALGERLEEPNVRLESLLGSATLSSRDDLHGARALASRALALARQVKNIWFVGRGLLVLGALAGRRQKEEGIGHLLEAAQIFEHLQAGYDLARAYLLLASLLDGSGRQLHLEEALTLGERGAYDALFLCTEKAVARPLLVEALALRVRPDYAGRLLAEMGAGGDLLPLIDHIDPSVRAQAASLLGETGERRAHRSLQGLLHDPAREVRGAAERALEQLASRPPLPLRVHLLGAFRIFRGNEPITSAAWKRSTAKVLLQYLISQRPRMVPEEAILEALWPGWEPDSAHAAFHNAVHALRKALEPDLAEARDSTYVMGRKDQYGLNPRMDCWVDAEEFERLARLGRACEEGGEIEQAIAAFRQADRLYAGDYLEESPYQEWTALQRERLRQLEVEVLLRLGELLAQSDAGAAIEAFRRAIALEPYTEPAYRGLMRLLAATGHRAEALQQYQTLERLLQRDLQVVPSSETTTLYRSLLTREV